MNTNIDDSMVLIDTTELSKLTGLSESSIRKACSGKGSGKITIPKITRIGYQIRFRVDHVKKWLDSLCSEPVKVIESHDFDSRPTSRPRPGRPRNVGGQK